MEHIDIIRYAEYGDYTRETFGVLTFGDFTCYTLKLHMVGYNET